MPALKAYRLSFLSRATPVRSYTLFGAICWSFKLLGKDLNGLIDSFERGTPPFLISDPMPIAQSNNTRILLFPKPALPVSKEFKREDDIYLKKDRKKVKKATRITFEVLRDVLEGKITEEAAFLDKSKFKISEHIISTTEEEPKLTEATDTSTRNILNRISLKSENLFTEEYHLFSDRFFFIWLINEKYENTLDECFELIQDNGLGANKNIGWGKVRIEPLKGFEKEIRYLSGKVKKASRFLTLSPVILQKDSIDFERSFYTIEPYKAPTDNTFGGPLIWKRKVIYVKEGAVLKSSKGSGFVGRLKHTDMGDFKVFQYGYEFPLEVKSDVQP